MKKFNALLLSILLCSILTAKEEEQHHHDGSNNIKINYETLNFSNSKKKKDGQRYGVEIDHENKQHHIQLYYEKTKTNTTNLIPKDLDVNKYTIKYQYKLNPKKRLTFLYATINDNIMKETNGGNIYGVGYSNNGIGAMQYFSDYPHFDVYQSDLKYNFNKQKVKTTLVGKYIHIKNKNSNNFSKKAKSDYLTGGVKFHTHYKGFHLGAGAYFGKRIFAVMKEGFKIQHHAMEFKESYMMGVGHSFSKNMTVHLRYGYHKAKEIPINNDNVNVKNLSLDIVYKF